MSAIFDKGIKITNSESNDAIKVNVQSEDGTIGYQNSIVFDKVSTGLISGGLITINSDNTKYDISPLVGLITNFDNPSAPIFKEVVASPRGEITPAYLNTSIITYVAIDEYGLVVQQPTPFTTSQERDLISLGAVIHSNKLNINVVNNIGLPSFGAANQLHDFMDAIGALNLTGNKFSANGANLKLNKSAGVIFKLGSNAQIDWRSPHQIAQGATTALTFRYRTQLSAEGLDITDLDPSKYDNAGVLTTVPPNKFTVQTVTLFQAGAVRIQYGQSIYNSLDEAEKAIATRSFITEPNIASNGIIRGYVILKSGTTSLQNITDAKLIEVTKFGSVSSGGLALTFANITAALGFTPENTANKNTANGYAGLGADGKLLSTQLPSITVTDTFVVANQAAMLAIVGETGDVAVRTDLNKSFILKGTNPSILGDWQELLTPTDAVQSFNGRTGTIVPTLNDYTADQVQETTTRVFQTPTQRTNNDATSPIQAQLNSKVSGSGTTNRLAKFTSSDSVGDSLISDNGITVNVSGTANFESDVIANRLKLENTNDLNFTNSSNNWSVKTSPSENKLRIIDNQLGADRLAFSVDTATFSSSVTSPSFVKSGGTIAQFLKADGSSDSTAYAPENSVVNLTQTQTISGNKVFTGALTRFDNPLLLKQLGVADYNQIGALSGALEFQQNSGNPFYFKMANTYFNFGAIGSQATVSNTLLTANRSYNLPNVAGTLALTSDLLPYATTSQTNLLSESLAQGQAYTDNFRSRVLSDAGTYLPTKTAHDVAKLKQQDLWNKASLVITPAGINTSKLYAIKPRNTSGDLDVVRATTATVVNEDGLIESVASNVPRIDYIDSTCPSVLVEPQRTNLLTYSEDFSNASWTKSNVTINTNQILSPDNTLTADLLTANTNNAALVRYNTWSNTIRTASVFAKKGTSNIFYFNNLSIAGNGVVFDLFNGIIVSQQSGFTGKIENYNNGWYRCSVTYTTNSTVQTAGFVLPTINDSIYIWGAQLEEGSYPTSYVPTVASAVTRNADVISKTGISDLIGQTEGTIFLDINLDTRNNFTYLFLNDGNYSNYIGFVFRENSIEFEIVKEDGLQCSIVLNNTSKGRFKIAGAYINNDFIFYVNGNLIGTDNLGIIPATSKIELFYNTSNIMKYNSVSLYKTRLSNAELATLTTL